MARASHPFPVQSALRGTGEFFSLAAPPPDSRAALDRSKGVPPRQYKSYGDWWQDQQAPDGLKEPPLQTASSGFWPYGKQITEITSREGKTDYYKLDGRYVLNSAPSMRRSPSAPGGLLPGRSAPSADFFCSHAEERQGMAEMHASASWHRSAARPAARPAAGSARSSGRESAASQALPADAGLVQGRDGGSEASSRRCSSNPFRSGTPSRTLSTAHPVGHEWRLPRAPSPAGGRR